MFLPSGHMSGLCCAFLENGHRLPCKAGLEGIPGQENACSAILSEIFGIFTWKEGFFEVHTESAVHQD